MPRSAALVPVLLAAVLSLATHLPYAGEVFCGDLEGGNGSFFFGPAQKNWDRLGFAASGGRPFLTIAPDSPRRGVLYGNHPPLSFWLMRPVIAAFGIHEWTLRLEGLLFSAVSAAIVAWLATRALGVAGGVAAALIFAALPLQFRYGLMAGFEPPTLLFGLAAQALLPPAGIGTRRPWLCAVAVFLATMTDHIGALFGPMLLLQEWMTTRRRPAARLTLLLLGAPAAALLCFATILCLWTGGPAHALDAVRSAAKSTALFASPGAWQNWFATIGAFLVLSFTWTGALVLVIGHALGRRAFAGPTSAAFPISFSWLSVAVVNVCAFPGRSLIHDYWWYYAVPAVVLSSAGVTHWLWSRPQRTLAVVFLAGLLANCVWQDRVRRAWVSVEAATPQRDLLRTLADADTLVLLLTDWPLFTQNVYFEPTVVAVQNADDVASLTADFRAGKLWPRRLMFVGAEVGVEHFDAISDALRARLTALGFQPTEPSPAMRALAVAGYEWRR